MKHISPKTEVAKLFSYGIATKALVLLESMGVIEKLIEAPYNVDSWKTNRRPAIEGSLKVLSYAGLVTTRGNSFELTPTGREAVESIDFFRLWFGAYGPLMNIPPSNSTSSINGSLVASASAGVGKKCVDPYLNDILSSLEIRGSICDLGCGNGLRIHRICKDLMQNGIGIDLNSDAIRDARTLHHHASSTNEVNFLCRDVTNLDQTFPEVDLLLQTFMTHHIVPDDRCVEVFHSYRSTFPSARYLLILDTVVPEDTGSSPEIFTPGFIFAHGLQGIIPRSKRRLLQVVTDAKFSVVKEVQLGVPNSFAWLLSFDRL